MIRIMQLSTTKKLCCCCSKTVVVLLAVLLSHSVGSSDTIHSGQSLSGNHTLSSSAGVFELGLFTPPGNPLNHYYLGIWYKNKPGNKTLVWVANRDRPLSNPDPSLSALSLSRTGTLTLLSGSDSNDTVWSSRPSASKASSHVIAVLLDTGNFVVRDESAVIWQSFDHPTDTWLPGGKIGYNKLAGERMRLTPWRNAQDPAPGIFSMEVEPNGTSHLLLWNGSKIYWTSGIWTGTYFTLVTEIQRNQYARNMTYAANENNSYFTYEATRADTLTRFTIDTTGQFKQYLWHKNSARWQLYWMKPPKLCDVYAFCGPYTKCDERETPLCHCLPGFETKSHPDWDLDDHSGGCVRKTRLSCGGEGDTFVAVSDVGLPSLAASESVKGETVDQCRSACLADCSCSAYVYGDDQCSIWKGELLNLKRLLPDEKVNMFMNLKISISDLKQSNDSLKKKKTTNNTRWIIVVAILAVACGVLAVVAWFVRTQCYAGPNNPRVESSLMVFRYRDLKTATKNFTEKLGEGGFGSVFKGTLLRCSTVVAVKTLKCLKQGEKQFRAEVKTIGAIQHVNLVRLRGFCADNSKRCLVYDYMSMGSLESILFQNSPTVLDWEVRYRIAIGTAKGLCYLHEECVDHIIHCDIKPENILLDSNYNPKVADFGMAKLMGRDFSRVVTTVRGTRGYLAPEWLSGQAITPKADVFSYGMLLFELISGRRNSQDLDCGIDHYFPCRVFESLNRGKEMLVDLFDSRLGGNGDEIMRAITAACWCIQDDEKQRPSMSLIVQILTGVMEVGVPPIPLFIQRLTQSPMSQPLTTSSSSGVSESTTQYFSVE